MRRSVESFVISLSVELGDGESLLDYVVPALLDYCGAAVAGEAGNAAHEFYEAANGVTLRIEHDRGNHAD